MHGTAQAGDGTTLGIQDIIWIGIGQIHGGTGIHGTAIIGMTATGMTATGVTTTGTGTIIILVTGLYIILHHIVLISLQEVYIMARERIRHLTGMQEEVRQCREPDLQWELLQVVLQEDLQMSEVPEHSLEQDMAQLEDRGLSGGRELHRGNLEIRQDNLSTEGLKVMEAAKV